MLTIYLPAHVQIDRRLVVPEELELPLSAGECISVIHSRLLLSWDLDLLGGRSLSFVHLSSTGGCAGSSPDPLDSSWHIPHLRAHESGHASHRARRGWIGDIAQNEPSQIGTIVRSTEYAGLIVAHACIRLFRSGLDQNSSYTATWTV